MNPIIILILLIVAALGVGSAMHDARADAWKILATACGGAIAFLLLDRFDPGFAAIVGGLVTLVPLALSWKTIDDQTCGVFRPMMGDFHPDTCLVLKPGAYWPVWLWTLRHVTDIPFGQIPVSKTVTVKFADGDGTVKCSLVLSPPRGEDLDALERFVWSTGETALPSDTGARIAFVSEQCELLLEQILETSANTIAVQDVSAQTVRTAADAANLVSGLAGTVWERFGAQLQTFTIGDTELSPDAKTTIAQIADSTATLKIAGDIMQRSGLEKPDAALARLKTEQAAAFARELKEACGGAARPTLAKALAKLLEGQRAWATSELATQQAIIDASGKPEAFLEGLKKPLTEGATRAYVEYVGKYQQWEAKKGTLERLQGVDNRALEGDFKGRYERLVALGNPNVLTGEWKASHDQCAATYGAMNQFAMKLAATGVDVTMDVFDIPGLAAVAASGNSGEFNILAERLIRTAKERKEGK